MTNTKHFNYKKVCRVYYLIGQICKIQGLDWLEEILLSQWTKMVLKNQDKAEEVAFILAKYSFLDYLRSEDNTMHKAPITAFLIDTIQSV